MGNYSARICTNCEQLLGTGVTKCTVCGQEFTGNEVGNPVPIEIPVDSKTPERSGIERLKKLLFKRTPPSKPERRKGLSFAVLGGIMCVAVSQVDFIVRGYYMQNGGYWFPCDIMPEINGDIITAAGRA